MPFITYGIENNLLKNPENINTKNFDKFIDDVDELNQSNRAILVEEVKFDTTHEILNKCNKIANSSLSLNLDEIKISLEKAARILGESFRCQFSKQEIKKITTDFVKNFENKLPTKIKTKYIKGAFHAGDFEGKANRFREDFFDKIKLFITSENSKENLTKPLNTIYIIHKELSKMILPTLGKRKIKKGYKEKDTIKAFLNKDLSEYMKEDRFGKNIYFGKEKDKKESVKLLNKENIVNPENYAEKYLIITNSEFTKLNDEELKKKLIEQEVKENQILDQTRQVKLDINGNPLFRNKFYDPQIPDGFFNLVRNLKTFGFSIDFFINWWIRMPENIIPSKIILVSDLPPALYNEDAKIIVKAIEMIKNFLFKDLTNHEKFKFDFLLFSKDAFKNEPEQDDRFDWWTHKRHFVFGSDLQFVFSSHFGAALIDNRGKEKLRAVTKLNVEDDEKDRHMRHLKRLIKHHIKF